MNREFSHDVSVSAQVLKEIQAFLEAQVVLEDQELKEAWEKWDYQVCLNPPVGVSFRLEYSDIAL